MNDFIQRVTWDEVGIYLNGISHKAALRQVSGVFGIPRGGLVLAAWLSHKLYVPLLSAPSPNCIIIDDICDSGETLLHHVRNSSSKDGKDRNYFITTMFYRKNDLDIEPDYYFKEKGDKWIVFPWEE